jgi:hypothetical protein
VTRWRLAGLIAALLCAALAVAIARQADDITSTSDTAVIESLTMLASSGHLTVGPYSRFQWHHPGPIYFYALAPFYAAAGHRTTGLDAGALILNLAALILIVWTLARRASPVLGLLTIAALALLIGRVPGLLTSPWNPHVPVLAIAALTVVAADVVSGSLRGLPIVAVLASLAAQTHVGMLPFALGVGAMASLSALIRARRSPAGERPVALVATTLAVILLVWTPVIVEQLTDTPGNLTLLWRYFVQESHPGPAWDRAVSAWADMLSGPLRPDFYLAQGWPWVESPVRWAEALSGLESLALIVAVVRWRARPFDRDLALMLGVGALLALWSATRADREIFDHAVFWMTALGALNLAVLAAVIVDAIGWHSSMLPAWTVRAAGVVLLSAAGSIGLLALRQAAALSHHPSTESIAATNVAADVEQFLTAQGVSRPLIRFDQDAWGMVAGVVLRLQKAGVPVAVENDWLVMFTPAFQASGREPLEIAIVGAGEHVRLSSRPGDQVLASRPPLFAHLLAPPAAPAK